MAERHIALIIADYPILVTTATEILRNRYAIVTRTWSTLFESPVLDADLIIVDVTMVSDCDAVFLLGASSPDARIVVCSLHRNEVEICRMSFQGLAVIEALPSLLSLAA